MTSPKPQPPQQPSESINLILSSLNTTVETLPYDAPRRFLSYTRTLHRLVNHHIVHLPPEISSSPSILTALKGIAADLAKAVETVSVYRERSKIYVLINCRLLCCAIQDRTVSIGGWLALLDSGLSSESEVRKKVSDLSRDMKHAQFNVTENEERVYCTLQREGQGRATTKPIQSAMIMDLARALGINPSDHAELSEHVKLLKKDLARSTSVSERRILMSLERIVNNWSVQPILSSLSLDFDVEDDSKILPFKNFLCPLTKEVMKDPVVLESGQTYERTAIDYWFQRCLEDGRDPTCPVTGQVLDSLEQKPNIGLAGAIEEWINRNVEIQIKSNLKYLSEEPPSAESVERVMDNIYTISEEHPASRYKIRNSGIVVLIIKLMKKWSKSLTSNLKTKALMALLSMTKDEDSKSTMIEEGITRLAVHSLVGSTEKEKETALKLLIEFSNNKDYCAKIASEKGALLLLSSISENLEQPTLSNLAEDMLKCLEMVDENVESLAAVGRFEPLLSRLCEGTETVQKEMALLLGQITLTNYNKEQIARRSANILVQMLHKPEATCASLKALRNLSCSDDNATILVESSVLPAVTDIVLRSQNTVPEEKELAAAVIANIVSNTGHWELAEVDKKGHSMLSSRIISEYLNLLSQVTPQCQASLLQILCGIASSPKASEQVANQIKSGNSIKTLIEFLEHPEKEHRIFSFKLLRIISKKSGEDLLANLRRLNKLRLILNKPQNTHSTNSEQSDAACLLANLPLSETEVTTILGPTFLKWTITALKEQQQIPSTRVSRSLSNMSEGLLGILLHFAKSTNPQILTWIKEHQLMSILRDQLTFLTQPRCKNLATLGLKHLSESGREIVADNETDILPPQGFCSSMVFICGRATPEPSTCPIHNSPCEENTQLCLLKNNCIKPLLDLLTDDNTDVQIAAIGAFSSLIPLNPVNYRRALDELDHLGVTDAVINLFIEGRPGELQESVVWMVERLLRGESSSRFSLNQSLVRALVEALKHGNASTRKLAQDALTNLKQLSGTSGKVSGPIRSWK